MPELTSPDQAAPDQATPDSILHRIEWQVIRRLDGLLQGDYQTLFYGAGVDFTDLREYQPQDDIRHIDWNVTARMNSPYVRQYVEDREITAWFLLDLSPSMGFGPADRTKEKVLVDFVATLARLLTRKGNRIGAIVYDNRLKPSDLSAFGFDRVIPPRGGRIQVLRLIHELQQEPDKPAGTATDLNVLLDTALNTLKRRSLVFLVSDFFSEPGWQQPLSLLNTRHELIAVRLWDQREVELPDAGLIVVEDAETGAQITVDTGDLRFRRRFQEATRRHEALLQEHTQKAGVDLFTLSTNEDLVSAIVRMATLRKNRSHLSAQERITAY
jgi:uncharacterized protein (DUF58 family)